MNLLKKISLFRIVIVLPALLLPDSVTVFAIDFFETPKLVEESSYQIQPGDELEIQVFREDDLSGKFQVDPSGSLNYPLVGKIEIAGMKLGEARDVLSVGLKRFLINPQVSISRAESTIKSISVLGQVKEAGTFDYAPQSSLMRVISEAGGFMPSANKKKVRIVRIENGEKKSMIVNANDIINGQSDDVELQPGDMIFVPESIF